MTRDELGDLWLTWYVQRSDPRHPFGPIWETAEDAQQLRVRDVVDDERAWEAMSQPDPNNAEWSHTGLIEEYEGQYADFEAVALILPAWRVPEGHILLDGMHRACALYRLNPPRLEVDVLALEPPLGWPDVQPDPRSRQTHARFPPRRRRSPRRC